MPKDKGKIWEEKRKTGTQALKLAQSNNHEEPCWSCCTTGIKIYQRKQESWHVNQTKLKTESISTQNIRQQQWKKKEYHCCFMLTQTEIVNAFSEIF